MYDCSSSVFLAFLIFGAVLGFMIFCVLGAGAAGLLAGFRDLAFFFFFFNYSIIALSSLLPQERLKPIIMPAREQSSAPSVPI